MPYPTNLCAVIPQMTNGAADRSPCVTEEQVIRCRTLTGEVRLCI